MINAGGDVKYHFPFWVHECHRVQDRTFGEQRAHLVLSCLSYAFSEVEWHRFIVHINGTITLYSVYHIHLFQKCCYLDKQSDSHRKTSGTPIGGRARDGRNRWTYTKFNFRFGPWPRTFFVHIFLGDGAKPKSAHRVPLHDYTSRSLRGASALS